MSAILDNNSMLSILKREDDALKKVKMWEDLVKIAECSGFSDQTRQKFEESHKDAVNNLNKARAELRLYCLHAGITPNIIL